MKIWIIGIGMGSEATMTTQAVEAIEGADVLIGARRMLDSAQELRAAKDLTAAEEVEAIAPSAIVEAVQARGDAEQFVVLCSGDTGFYSLATSMARTIEERLPQVPVEFIPGITTVQYLAAKLGRPWQNVALASAHGTTCNVIGLVLSHDEVFLLTGGDLTPQTIIDELVKCGLGSCYVAVAERLSYDDERITQDKAAKLAGQAFDSLSALWISHGPLCDLEVAPFAGSLGIPDELFIRGEVPMTKRDIRALCTSKLRVHADEVVWDIGAGTGSISIEVACMQPTARVYAIEFKEVGCELIGLNRSRFGAYNVTVVQGRAPEALEGLPAPDAAFIGGSAGGMAQIIDTVLAANPRARIVISAITLETIAQTQTILAELTERGTIGDYKATLVSVATSRKVGDYHLMGAENPIYIFEAQGQIVSEQVDAPADAQEQ